MSKHWFRVLAVGLCLVMLCMGGCLYNDPMPDDMYTRNIYPGIGSPFDIGAALNTYENGYFAHVYAGGVELINSGLPDQTGHGGEYLTTDGSAASWAVVGGGAEVDPVFTGSPAGGILAGDIIDWDTAYGWGDHSLVGYLTAEVDPVFSANGVNISGIPSDGQVAIWTSANAIEGSTIGSIMVAASDATAAEKVQALASGGAVCDGTADEVEINAAIVTCGTKGIVMLTDGTYYPDADVVLNSGITISGMNRSSTIVNFDNAAYQFIGTTTSGVEIRNMTVMSSIDANGAIYFTGGAENKVINVKVLAGTTKTKGIYVNNSGYFQLEGCYLSGFAAGGAQYGAQISSDYSQVIGCSFMSNSRGVTVSYGRVVGNYFYGNGDYALGVTNNCLVSGNWFYQSSNRMVFVQGDSCVVTGNEFRGGGIGVYLGAGSGTGGHVIVGNTFFNSSTIFIFSGYTGNMIVGNHFDVSTTVTNPEYNMILNNIGLDSNKNINVIRMKNTSGGGLVVGNVVTLKAVAAGDEITTTVNVGDDLVFGMATGTVANNAYGLFLVEGKTIHLKVDGTINIAIGDFLCTFSTAGIAQQAASGDMAFAIALEAYSTDDSNGVIDALLIEPRKIG